MDFKPLSQRIAGGDVAAWLDARRAGWGRVALALIGLAISVAICRFFYRRKIFLRL